MGQSSDSLDALVERTHEILRVEVAALGARYPLPHGRQSLTLCAADDYCNRKGGRVRPMLVLGTAQFLGQNPADYLDAAAGLEAVHHYTLLHDDVFDESGLRKNQPTAHVRYGAPCAIMGGTALNMLGSRLIGRNIDSLGFTLEQYRSITDSIDSLWMRMLLGEEMDLIREGKIPQAVAIDPQDRESLVRMTVDKSIILTACLVVPGYLSKRSPRVIKKLTDAGEALTFAYQLYDDLKDLTRTTHELGKDSNRDVGTYPRIFGIDAARGIIQEQRRIVTELLGEISSSRFPAIDDLFTELSRV